MIFIYLGMLKIRKVLLNPLFETKFGVYFIRSKVLCLLPSISLDGRLFCYIVTKSQIFIMS